MMLNSAHYTMQDNNPQCSMPLEPLFVLSHMGIINLTRTSHGKRIICL